MFQFAGNRRLIMKSRLLLKVTVGNHCLTFPPHLTSKLNRFRNSHNNIQCHKAILNMNHHSSTEKKSIL